MNLRQTLAVLVTLISAPVRADPITCIKVGNLAHKCVIDQTTELAQPITEGSGSNKIADQTDYHVTYSFTCSGGPINIAWSAGAGVYSLASAPALQFQVVTGSGALKLDDPDPSLTSRYYFASCTLTVQSVAVYPGPATLTAWQGKAQSQATIIADAIDAWLLARDYDGVIAFDDSKLVHMSVQVKGTITGMLAEVGLTWDQMINPATGDFWDVKKPDEARNIPDAWNDLVTVHGDLIDLVLLYNYAEDAAAGRPPAHTSVDVVSAAKIAGSTQAGRYLLKLKAAVADGQAILDTASTYIAELAGDLKNLQDAIASDQKKYPVDLSK